MRTSLQLLSHRGLAISALVLGSVLAGCSDSSNPLLTAPVSVSAVPARYIVVLRDSARGMPTTDAVDEQSYGHALNGYSAMMTPDAAAALARDARVRYVERDGIAHISGTQDNAPWGVDRIDQHALPLNTHFTSSQTGAGVRVYILDTGVRLSHSDFDGRAVTGLDVVTPGGNAGDCHGHGTHVAGTAGGGVYGVAKSATIVSVRVFDCTGSGPWTNVITGIDWVIQQKLASPTVPMVINLSLTGDASQAFDDAIQRATETGIIVVAGAGNDGDDACNHSPGRSRHAIVVAASDKDDVVASYSNVGRCVDLFAPGTAIVSDYNNSDRGTATASGTSMAAPHVAGAAALYLGRYPAASTSEVKQALIANATTGVLSSLRDAATPNRLVYTGFIPAPGQFAAPTGRNPQAGDGVPLT